MSYIWPLILMIVSNTVYHVCAKSLPTKLDPLASLTVSYFFAAISSGILYLVVTRGSADLLREYSGMMPEQAVQQAFRRQTGEYPEPAARSAWEDIRRREQQAEQRRDDHLCADGVDDLHIARRDAVVNDGGHQLRDDHFHDDLRDHKDRRQHGDQAEALGFTSECF